MPEDVNGLRIPPHYFCPDDCPFLNITEVQQRQSVKMGGWKATPPHRCTKYNEKLYHEIYHPKIRKCEECLKNDKSK